MATGTTAPPLAADATSHRDCGMGGHALNCPPTTADGPERISVLLGDEGGQVEHLGHRLAD